MGYVEFSLIGSDCEQLISRLISEGIRLRHIRNIKNEFFIRVSPYYYLHIARLAREYRLRTRIVKKRGLVFSLYPYRRRYGIFIGSAVSAVLLTVLSMFSWVTDISGNSAITDTQLLMLLDSYGIRTGRLRSEMSAEEIELLAPVLLGELSWISVEFNGSRISVKVSEREKTDLYTVRESSPCNIIADRNALIVDAEVYSGVLQATEGGGVKKGDIIIGGIVTDAAGNLLYNHAKGKITAEYIVTEVFEAEYTVAERVLSDRTASRSHLVLFGFDIPLYSEEYNNANARFSEKKRSFDFFGITLPWNLYEYIYTEYDFREITRGDDDLRRILRQRREMYEQNELSDSEILSYEEKYSTDENGMRLEMVYNLRGEIGVEQEIFIQNG